MTQIVVRWSAWKNGVLAAVCTAFVLALLSMLGTNSPQTKAPLGGGLFFAFGAVLFGYRTFNRRPRLIIDENGINAPFASIGFIPWSEVRATRIRYLGRVDTIQVTLKDPSAWVARLTTSRRLLWRWFPKTRVITFSLQNMDVQTSDIAELVSGLPAAKLAQM